MSQLLKESLVPCMADETRKNLETDALTQNVHAVHICNWDEYVSSLRALLPWMVAYDNNKYGRWLPDFWAMLTALPADQVDFLRSNFAQSIPTPTLLGTCG